MKSEVEYPVNFLVFKLLSTKRDCLLNAYIHLFKNVLSLKCHYDQILDILYKERKSPKR